MHLKRNSVANKEIASSTYRSSTLKGIPFRELCLAYLVHSALKKPILKKLLFKIGTGRGLMILSRLIKLTIYKVFVAGESLTECLTIIDKLNNRNVFSIPDYAVEGKAHEESFKRTYEQLIKTIDSFGQYDSVPFIVFKVSALCDQQLLTKMSLKNTMTDEETNQLLTLSSRLNKICEKAYHFKLMVLVDAEESWIQPAIDEFTEHLMLTFNQEWCCVFNTVQCYRSDREKYIYDLVGRLNKRNVQIGIKLVRGAYMEGEKKRANKLGYMDPINSTIEETHRMFNSILEWTILEPNVTTVCATHNRDSCLHAVETLKSNPEQILWFAQLLGMSDYLSYELADMGFPVAKYIPYGPIHETIPYLTRRVDENSAVKQELGRDTKWTSNEIARRLKSIFKFKSDA
jgi:proline dehydrogenase